MKILSSFRLLTLVGLAAGLGLSACDPLECAEGTREEDGKCVPLNQVNSNNTQCGPRTVLVGSQCVPLYDDICGPNTEAEAVLDGDGQPTGEFICVGQSGGDQPDPCPDVGVDGKICVSGWIRWLIDDGGRVLETTYVEPGATADATRVKVYVYDPLLYATNPNTPPLAVADVNPMNGTFTVTGIAVPAVPYIALVVDEDDGQPDDILAFTGIPYEVGTQNLERVTAAVITNDQVEAWSEAVGGTTALEGIGCVAPAGGGDHTLLTCGTWIGAFFDGVQDEPGNPVAGVVPHMGANPLDPSKTFYMGYTAADGVVFDEPAAGAVWSDGDGPHEWTGSKGVALFPTALLGTNYGGQCAPSTSCESQGCLFATDLTGGATPGALFVQYVFPTVACGP